MRTRITAVAAALVLVALGIVIGAGPLQGDAQESQQALASQKAAIAARDSRIRALEDEVDLGSAYTGASAARVVSGLLAGRKVAVVTLPGVKAKTVELLRGLVHAAGGEVSAQVDLAPMLLDSSNAGLVEALTSQMAAQTSGLAVPSGASAYQRFGALLARAIGVPPSAHAVGAAYDATSISIISGLTTAKLLTKASVSARAGLTIVVLPARTGASQQQASAVALGTYLSQIPGVVAGSSESAGRGGLLALLRDGTSSPASSVDSLETSTGRVSVVLALAARTRGVTGDYGTVGRVDGAVPPLP